MNATSEAIWSTQSPAMVDTSILEHVWWECPSEPPWRIDASAAGGRHRQHRGWTQMYRGVETSVAGGSAYSTWEGGQHKPCEGRQIILLRLDTRNVFATGPGKNVGGH